jgi:hypothetical protein
VLLAKAQAKPAGAGSKKMRRKSACFTEFLNRPVVVFIFSLLRKFSLFVDFEAGMRGQHLL